MPSQSLAHGRPQTRASPTLPYTEKQLYLTILRHPERLTRPLRSSPRRPSTQALHAHQPFRHPLLLRPLLRTLLRSRIHDSLGLGLSSFRLVPEPRLGSHFRELDHHLHRLPSLLLRLQEAGYRPQGTALEGADATVRGLDWISRLHDTVVYWGV